MTREPVRVVRLSQVDDHAVELLHEYYEAVQVQVRDTPDELQQIVRDPDAGFWIGYLNGWPAGCVCSRILPHLPLAVECKRLYVRPQARGKGVARVMLDAQEAYARTRGHQQIFLDSKDDLKDALALYAARGFVPCERYNDNPQATVFMMKQISQGPH
jgi:GNAT superfamily N-acetyltransferase